MQSLQNTGYGIRVLTCAEDTGGVYGVIEITTEPGGGPPPHTHTKEREDFYVVFGVFTIYVQGQPPLTIGPGERAFGPKGICHYFRNTGEGPGRMLAILTPGGGEQYFKELEVLRAKPGADLLEREEEIDRRYGMVINRR